MQGTVNCDVLCASSPWSGGESPPLWLAPNSAGSLPHSSPGDGSRAPLGPAPFTGEGLDFLTVDTFTNLAELLCHLSDNKVLP